MGFPSRLVPGIREQKVGRTLLLLLKTTFNQEFLLDWFRRFLEKKVLGYEHPDQRSNSLKVSEFKSARCVVKKSLLVESSCAAFVRRPSVRRSSLLVPLVGYLQGEQGYNCPLKVQKQIESNLFKSGKQPCCEARISFCEARSGRSVDPLDLF